MIGAKVRRFAPNDTFFLFNWADAAAFKIYATVGTKEKVDFLAKSLQIPQERIFNSRDSSFLPSIMQATDGRGVDIVLNSLAGQLLHASWECVAPHGKMIELGKRDFLTHGVLDMSPFLSNRSFAGVDLMGVLKERPDILEQCVEQPRGIATQVLTRSIGSTVRSQTPAKTGLLSRSAPCMSTMQLRLRTHSDTCKQARIWESWCFECLLTAQPRWVACLCGQCLCSSQIIPTF